MDYIVLSIGKIYIKRFGRKLEYYKQVNTELYRLNESEEKYLKNILVAPGTYVYRSEKLNNIIDNNPTFIEHKEYLTGILEFIEKVIPINYRDNFYSNLTTLDVRLNFDLINKKYLNTTAIQQTDEYDSRANTVTLSPISMRKILDISKKATNPNEFFWTEISSTLTHELLHMASSNYNEETSISLCGFDKYPKEKDEAYNRGLTEGVTEVLSMVGVPKTTELSSGYYNECLFVNQMVQIMGGNTTILESYFGNLGTKPLETKLVELDGDSNQASELFQKIEDNFNLRNLDCEQSILGNIQSKLVYYYGLKVQKDLENGVSKEQILNSMELFKRMLVTKENLTVREKNPNNYPNLNESIKSFLELEISVLNKLSSKQY